MSGPQKNFCLVYYYVPEDFDDPDIPNVFGINVSQDDLRVSHIKNNFPLEGEYHFRFKCKYSNLNVWMDLDDENSKLPLFNGRIFLKATRITWNSDLIKKEKENENKANNFIFSAQPNPQNYTSSNYFQPQTKQEYNLNQNHDNNTVQKPYKDHSDLLDFENIDLKNDVKIKKNSPKKNDNLIDF